MMILNDTLSKSTEKNTVSEWFKTLSKVQRMAQRVENEVVEEGLSKTMNQVNDPFIVLIELDDS